MTPAVSHLSRSCSWPCQSSVDASFGLVDPVEYFALRLMGNQMSNYPATVRPDVQESYLLAPDRQSDMVKLGCLGRARRVNQRITSR